MSSVDFDLNIYNYNFDDNYKSWTGVKINWNQLSANPKANHLLFKLDYTQRETKQDFREELMSYIFQPDRLIRLSRQFNLDLQTYLSFI